MRPPDPAPQAARAPVKTTLVLLLAVSAQAAGNTCLSRAMKAIGADAGASAGFSADVIVRGMETPLVWVGILLGLVFFALFLAALSWEDLSFVLPVSSVGYVLNVAFARWFLAEPVSVTRWIGTALVILGVALVAGTARGGPPPPGTPNRPWPRGDGAATDASAPQTAAGRRIEGRVC